MADIVLKDRNGEDVTYEGIETVTFDTPEEGVQVTFTEGVAVENVEIALSLEEGNQNVEADSGTLMRSVVIQKPGALLPENIKKDVEIAGVKGTLIGTGVTKEIELDFSGGDQTVQADEGTLIQEVVIKQPDTLIPENIAFGVEVAGVIGTAATDFDVTDELLKYFTFSIDGKNKMIILHTILYDKLYADSGSYDVEIPDKIGGYDVIINNE